MPTRRRLPSLIILALLIVSSLPIGFVSAEPYDPNNPYYQDIITGVTFTTKFGVDSKLDMTTGLVEISKWGKEVWAQFGTTSTLVGSEKTPDNKYKLTYGEYAVQVYELPNGLEYEFIIGKIPLSNVFTIPITSQNLNFYYQPALDTYTYPAGWVVNATHAFNEKGKLVDERPINVVGSYAVYTDKRNNQYESGKVCQIYRPKAVASDGEWIWGVLNYNGTALTVTVDQAWLAKAKYPVVIDPTIGYETAGGSWSSIFYTPTGSKFASAAGTATLMSAYLKNSDIFNAHNAQSAIYYYSDTSSPYSEPLVVSSGSVTIPKGDTGHWFDFNIADTVVDGTDTILVATVDGMQVSIAYDDLNVKNKWTTSQGFGSWANPEDFSLDTLNDVTCSIHYDYTAGGTDFPRGAGLSVTLTKAGAHIIGFIRGDSLSLTLAKTTTRVGGFKRATTATITLTDAAMKTLGYIRGVAEAFTLSDAATTTYGYIRAAADTLTLSSAGTRLIDYLRAATGGFTVADAGAAIIGYVRSATQGFILASSAARFAELIRAAIGDFTLGSSVSVLVQNIQHFIADVGQSITVAANAARQIDLLRGIIQALNLSNAATRIVDYLRDAQFYSQIGTGANRIMGYARDAAQSLSLASTTNRFLGFIRDATRGFTLTNAGDRFIGYIRASAQNLILSSDATRFIGWVRDVSQGLVLGSAATKAAGFVRGVAEGIVLSDASTRFVEAARGAAQGIVFSDSATRLYGAIRGATQGLTLTSSADRIMGWVRNAVQSINLADVATRLIGFLRTAAQGITFDSLANAVAVSVHNFIRGVSQGLTVATDAARQIDFFRDAGQTISTALSGLGHLVMNYVANVGINIILHSWGWGVLNATTGGGLPYWLIIVGVAALVFFLMIRRR